MAYFIDQILNIRLDSEFKGTHLGSSTHKVLEIISKAKKKLQDDGKGIHESKVFGKYIINDDIDPLIDRVYNHYSHTTKNVVNKPWEDEDRLLLKKMVYKAIEYEDGLYSPLKRDIIDVEKRFKLPIEKEWAKLPNGEYFVLTGFIDLVTKIGDAIEIIDWKTSKYSKDFNSGEEITYEKLKFDIQLLIYHYACKRLYGNDKSIITTIFFVNNKLGPQTLHLEDRYLGELEDKVQAQFHKIRTNNNPQQNISFFCRSVCAYGRNSFKNTNLDVKILNKNWEGGVEKDAHGYPAKICDQVKRSLDLYQIDRTIRYYSKNDK